MPRMSRQRQQTDLNLVNRFAEGVRQRILERRQEVEERPVFLSVQVEADLTSLRTAEFQGDEHLVVPMVILVEGVLWPANSESPELALAEEFGKAPEGWNGRPVVLGHPKKNGIPISANSPEVLEAEAFGQLFNTTLDGNKLKSEAWINLSRVEELGENVQAAVERLQNSTETTEVSTGMFVGVEPVKGVFNGEEFTGIWRGVVPDHLAILPEGVTGACSVEDGCGAPRTNTQRRGSVDRGIASSSGSGSDPDGSSSCPTRKVQVLASGSSFLEAFPHGAPVHTAEDTVPDPTHECESCAAQRQQETKGLKGLLTRFAEAMGFKFEGAELSDRDLREALTAALVAEDPNSFFYLIAVFEDSFVYEDGWNYTLVSRGYSIAEDGKGVVTLGGDKTPVRPVTEFVPVTTESEPPNNPGDNPTEEMSTMSQRAKRVAALIANERTPYTEDDVQWLTALEDEQFDKVEATTVVEEPADPEEDDKGGDEGTPSAATPTPETLEQYIARAPAAVQEVLNEGVRMQAERRASLTKTILDCDRNKFTKQDLEGFKLGTLEQLASLARTGPAADYSGAHPRVQEDGDDDTVPPAPLAFERKKATAA